MSEKTRIYREWQITAEHTDTKNFGTSPYVFTWSAWTTPHFCPTNEEAEAAARSFAGIARRGLKNIKLRSRTVTVEPWAEESLTVADEVPKQDEKYNPFD